MGVESRQDPPLPAPTETESLTAPTDLATDVSRPGDDKTSFSLPDDGTPVTIRTRRHKPDQSQTSLLIEYFEGSKSAASSEAAAPGASTRNSSSRKPSVRVRLTPSRNRTKGDRIQITESKSRKASLTRRNTESPTMGRHRDLDVAESEDARSQNSYASATEESNVSRNPIEVDIDPGRHRRRGERKVSSPLIPAADSKASSYQPADMSDISAIPTDSFLDGSGGTNVTGEGREARETKSGKGEPLVADGLGAAAGAVAAEKMRRKGRSASHDRSATSLTEKSSRSDRKHRPKSRTSSVGEKHVESKSSPRRRSKSRHQESAVSGADSSVLSSQLSPSHRSYDSHSSSKVSINNPKLLQAVEDAVRRLILPELESIKRERSHRDSRRSKDRDSFSSATSRDDVSLRSKRKSGDTAYSTRSGKDRRDREPRNELSPRSSSSVDQVSLAGKGNDGDADEKHGHDILHGVGKGLATGLAAGAGRALAGEVVDHVRSRSEEKSERRRRRARTPRRGQREQLDEYDETGHEAAPPMPLMGSEMGASDLTRPSIQSAESETDRPHSASEEMTSVHDAPRSSASTESMQESLRNTPTPTGTPAYTLQSLGARHANVSHGDLRALPRGLPGEYGDEEYEANEYGHGLPPRAPGEYQHEYGGEGRLRGPDMFIDDEEEDDEDEDGDDSIQRAYYGEQVVPKPLRYVPYKQERRGLSPIQSVSGYTEGDSEHQPGHDPGITQSNSEMSSPGKSSYRDQALRSPSSVPSNMRSHEFGDEDSVRSSGGDGRNRASMDDSEVDPASSGQALRGLGANPQFVHPPAGTESAVASVVDGDPSVLSASGSAGRNHRGSQYSYDDGIQDTRSGDLSPSKDSADSRHGRASALSQEQEPSAEPGGYSEFEVDERGHKIPSRYRRSRSPKASEQAIKAAALGRAAAAALQAMNRKDRHTATGELDQEEDPGVGVSRNRSFKERTRNGFQPNATPRHSVDRLSEISQPEMGTSGLPDADHPMPEIGYGYGENVHTPSAGEHGYEDHLPAASAEEDDRYGYDAQPSPVAQGPLGGSYPENREQWPRDTTPTQERMRDEEYGRAATPRAGEKGHGVGTKEMAPTAALAPAHSRQPSRDHDDDWKRDSVERKRDTLVTNPYEDSSPIANLPGMDSNMLGPAVGFGNGAYRGAFHSGSPGMKDEGYISAPHEPPNGRDAKDKGVDFMDQPAAGDRHDPFYAPNMKQPRDFSGLSQGGGTPLYDASTGAGIDRIGNKDIISLMEHVSDKSRRPDGLALSDADDLCTVDGPRCPTKRKRYRASDDRLPHRPGDAQRLREHQEADGRQ